MGWGMKGLLEGRCCMVMGGKKCGIWSKEGVMYSGEIVDCGYSGEIDMGIYNSCDEFEIIEGGRKLVEFIDVGIYVREGEEVSDEEL